MKIIRRGVFETNSSSMHALTVPEDLYDSWQLIHDYVSKDLERFKVGENSYNIVFDVNDNNMDGEDFSIRRYIPHYSVVDKAFYAIATIAQHYGFTQEEVDYIANFDIKFRMGSELNEE